MTERLTASSVPVRASGEPQKHTIRVISHGPTLIERAQQWQREHAEANTPFPDDTYLLIRDFLIAASPSDDGARQPQDIDYGGNHAMESGATQGVDDGGLDRPASDLTGVPVAADATPYQGPRGTYNCPICGWNVPHREHAGEVIEQLSFELNAWKAWWQHVALMLKSGIRLGWDSPTCQRVIMRSADDSAAYLSVKCTCGKCPSSPAGR